MDVDVGVIDYPRRGIVKISFGRGDRPELVAQIGRNLAGDGFLEAIPDGGELRVTILRAGEELALRADVAR